MVNSGTGQAQGACQAASKIGLECFRRRNKIGAFLFESIFGRWTKRVKIAELRGQIIK